MFGFLKRKTKIRPEDLGIVLAQVLESLWFTKISEHVSQYKNLSGITDEELNNLWRVLLMLHCTAISVGVESTGAAELNKKIVLDAFWNTVPDLLKEQVSEAQAQIFRENVAIWYPTLQKLIVDPSSGFPNEGSLGPGKVLFQLAMPKRDLKENVDMMDIVVRLTGEFVSTYVAQIEFAVNSVNKSKFTESMISYE